jgi:hypothetical protein
VGVAHADFFFSEDIMSIVTGDDEGVIRIYEYNPNGKLKISLVIFLPHYRMQILSPKMGNTCCAGPNSMVKARASHLSSSLVVLKKNLSFHKPSLSAVRNLPITICPRAYTRYLRCYRWFFVVSHAGRRIRFQKAAAPARSTNPKHTAFCWFEPQGISVRYDSSLPSTAADFSTSVSYGMTMFPSRCLKAF